MKITWKYIGYAVIFILVTAVSVQSCRLSIKTNKLNQVNTDLSLLEYKISTKKDSLNLLASQVTTLKSHSDLLNQQTVKLQKDNKILNKELTSVLSKIDSIPPDESYAFLQDSAYNYYGYEKKYPFSTKQVTEIHKDFVENGMLQKINVNLAITVDILQKQIGTQDSIIFKQSLQNTINNGIISELDSTVREQSKLNKDLNTKVNNKTRLVHVLEGAGALELLYILITLI